MMYWNRTDIEIVNIDGQLYALDGWNTEVWTNCWKCKDEFTAEETDDAYTVRPIYKYERDSIDLDSLEEGSDEWEDALEIVDYEVMP